MLENLKGYRLINDALHTAAQPTREQLPELKQQGIELVINLARSDSPDAVTDEAELVKSNDMQYINIPVDFKQPLLSDFQDFVEVMQAHRQQCKLVHCAYNWRVSCFVYLYRVLIEHQDPMQAQQDMLAIWQPDPTWQTFIDDCLAHPDRLETGL